METSNEEPVAKRLRSKKSNMKLMELPNECLLKILGYLSNFDVLKNVAVVSKRFHGLSQDKHLIRKIEVDSESWPENQKEEYCKGFLEVLNRSLNLTFLSFCKDFRGEMFLKALSSMNHQFLREFNLKTKEDFLDVEILKYLEKCPNLKVLKFEFEPQTGNEITQIVIHPYLTWITNFKLKNLQEFEFGYELVMDNSEMFKDFLEIFAENFPKLQHLCLTTDQLNHADECDKICQEFASRKNIKLEIRGPEMKIFSPK